MRLSKVSVYSDVICCSKASAYSEVMLIYKVVGYLEAMRLSQIRVYSQVMRPLWCHFLLLKNSANLCRLMLDCCALVRWLYLPNSNDARTGTGNINYRKVNLSIISQINSRFAALHLRSVLLPSPVIFCAPLQGCCSRSVIWENWARIRNKKLNPDPHWSQNSGASQAQNEALEAQNEVLEAWNGASEGL